MRRLDLIVGPNGSGKSTFVLHYLAPALPTGVLFVNADEIARQRWPDAGPEHAYEAAEVAAQTRMSLITEGRSFIAETVFSHPSKLELIDLAHESAFEVILHVLMVPVDLAVMRVAARVDAGGHPVPERKIRERYDRLWPLVAQAVHASDQTFIYDNSAIRGPALIARFTEGIALDVAIWPAWAPASLTQLS